MKSQYQEISKAIREELESFFGSRSKELSYPNKPKESYLMTLDDVAAHFQVTKVSIHKWEKAKILPQRLKMGSRVYYKREDIYKMKRP
jgi:predicted DNA-binding transcriptional regulator AlpA